MKNNLSRPHPFSFLNAPYADEIAAFGPHWCGPKEYEHGEDALVALYTSSDDSDGQSVEVYCCAMPARFYTLKVLAGKTALAIRYLLGSSGPAPAWPG